MHEEQFIDRQTTGKTKLARTIQSREPRFRPSCKRRKSRLLPYTTSQITPGVSTVSCGEFSDEQNSVDEMPWLRKGPPWLLFSLHDVGMVVVRCETPSSQPEGFFDQEKLKQVTTLKERYNNCPGVILHYKMI